MRSSLTVPARLSAARVAAHFAAVLLCASAAFAAEPPPSADPQAQPGAVEAIKNARTESLELPGVTACHTCEWRPMRTQMEATQCATKIGVFDCGRDTDCEKKCEFVQCADQ
jgi:hypothetical protein